jgi:hypothetical protein
VKGLCVENVRKLEVDHESFDELKEAMDKHDTLLREALEKNEKSTTHDNRATFDDGNRGLQQVVNYGYGVYGCIHMGDCHDNIFLLLTTGQYEQTIAEFHHRIAIWILFDPKSQSYPLRILESGPRNIEGVPSWVPTWESKKWSGEDKIHGAPESEYDTLAQGTSMG